MTKPHIEIVMLADLHLRDNDPLGRGVGLENTRLRRKLAILDLAVKAAVESTAEQRTLMLLGDIFDSPRIPEWLRAEFFQTLRPLLECGSVWCVGDNHTLDRGTWPFASEHLLASVAKREAGRWCFRFFAELTDWVLSGGWPVVVVPFGWQDRIAAVPANGKILFGHWPVKGGWYGAVQSPDGVDPAVLANYGMVFLGDFHRRQDVFGHGIIDCKSHKEPHSYGFKGYVGSAAATDFGEVDYDHKIARLRLWDYPSYELEWLDAGDCPMWQFDVWYTDEWAPLHPDMVSRVDGGLVKISFNGIREQLATLDQRPYLEALAKAEFVRVETVLLDDGVVAAEQSADLRPEWSASDLIVAAAESDERRAEIGMDIYRAVGQ